MDLKLKYLIRNFLDNLLQIERRTLLWTNPAPTSSFAPQTVSLDLSGYDMVEMVSFKTVGEIYYFYTKTPAKNMYSNGIKGDAFFTQGSVSFDREYEVTSSGIVFGTGYYFGSGYSKTADNSRAVPYKIYGIKFGGI